jgi:hypothetical protein
LKTELPVLHLITPGHKRRDLEIGIFSVSYRKNKTTIRPTDCEKAIWQIPGVCCRELLTGKMVVPSSIKNDFALFFIYAN